MTKGVHLTFFTLLLSGCAFLNAYLGLPDWEKLDATANSWIGKTKDERIVKKGPPESCAQLKNGDEVCEWVARGYSSSGGGVNCSPGGGCIGGGSSGSSWEHHIIYRYNNDGIAVDWNYRGTWGTRNMADSQRRTLPVEAAPSKSD